MAVIGGQVDVAFLQIDAAPDIESLDMSLIPVPFRRPFAGHIGFTAAGAADQGDLVARVIAGEDVTYTALPWFWSDQYDCKLQIVGLNLGHDSTVVRPGPSDSVMSVWYYAGERLCAIDAMNDPKAYAFGRKIIEDDKNPAKDVVADPDTDLKAIAKG